MARPNVIVHRLINKERRRRGIPAVRWNSELHFLARDQANYCAKIGRLEHSRRYAFQGGENLCGGSGNMSPRTIVNTWLRSRQGHREYILSPNVKYAAVAISRSRRGTYCAWAFGDESWGHNPNGILSWFSSLLRRLLPFG